MGGDVAKCSSSCSECIGSELCVPRHVPSPRRPHTNANPARLCRRIPTQLTPNSSNIGTTCVHQRCQEISDVVCRETWFDQNDVNAFVENGINTVRIPVGVCLRRAAS